jgi:hypothetical protein
VLSLLDYSIGPTYTIDPLNLDDNPFYVWSGLWQCNYVDSLPECSDTLHYKPNYQKISIVDPDGIPLEGLTSYLRGKEIGTGEFLYTLFPGCGSPIEFHNTYSTVALCTLSYVDTGDTLCRTITGSVTSVKNPSESISNLMGTTQLFSVINNTSDCGSRFIIATPTSFRHATIKVYTTNGRVVATIDIPSKTPGTHMVSWNEGTKLSPGNYLCKLSVDGKEIASRNVPFF